MVNTDIFHNFSGSETTIHRCPQGYEEDTVQVFEERLKEFLAEDFRKFSVEVEKGAISGSKIWGEISCYSISLIGYLPKFSYLMDLIWV